jgi:hypothetical protein
VGTRQSSCTVQIIHVSSNMKDIYSNTYILLPVSWMGIRLFIDFPLIATAKIILTQVTPPLTFPAKTQYYIVSSSSLVWYWCKRPLILHNFLRYGIRLKCTMSDIADIMFNARAHLCLFPIPRWEMERNVCAKA